MNCFFFLLPIISFLYTTFTHKEKHTQMRQKKEEKKKSLLYSDGDMKRASRSLKMLLRIFFSLWSSSLEVIWDSRIVLQMHLTNHQTNAFTNSIYILFQQPGCFLASDEVYSGLWAGFMFKLIYRFPAHHDAPTPLKWLFLECVFFK